MKNIYLIIKKLVVSLCLIYSLNIIICKTGIIIPINIYTISIISILGVPGIVCIIVLMKII